MDLGRTRPLVTRPASPWRRSIFPAALLPFFLLTPAPGQSCRDLLDSGDVFYKRFENRRALDHYKQAFRECPSRYEALWKMTRAINDVGEDIGGEKSGDYFVKAMRYADSLQARYPDSVPSHFLKAAAAGNLALLRGGAEQVRLARIIERNCRKAIDLDSGYAPAYVVLGVYYRKVATASGVEKTFANIFLGGIPEGTLEDSERALRTALRLGPDNIFAHLEIARTLLHKKRAEAAKAHLRRVLDLPVTGHQDPELKEQAQALLDRIGAS